MPSTDPYALAGGFSCPFCPGKFLSVKLFGQFGPFLGLIEKKKKSLLRAALGVGTTGVTSTASVPPPSELFWRVVLEVTYNYATKLSLLIGEENFCKELYSRTSILRGRWAT